MLKKIGLVISVIILIINILNYNFEFEFNDVANALSCMRENRHFGKLILKV